MRARRPELERDAHGERPPRGDADRRAVGELVAAVVEAEQEGGGADQQRDRDGDAPPRSCARGAADGDVGRAGGAATSAGRSCVRLAGLAVLVALIGDCPDHQARDRDQREQEPEQVLPTVAHGLDGSRRNGRRRARRSLPRFLSALPPFS